jgi:1-pyrroline-5-carboxylate dehydrogenase
MASPDLAGIHFTGSTGVFQGMWKTVGETIHQKKYYPRIVGETGGKDFIFAHNTADVDELAVGAVRGAFEYQGQKCSAASRMYVPASLWPPFKKKYLGILGEMKMGPPEDFTNFVAAVIDKGAYETITDYIDYAVEDNECELISGGNYDDSKGYFIEPTTVVTTNPRSKLMEEEIFGPVLTIYVYDDDKLDETLGLCNTTSPFALTGAVFGRDRQAVTRVTNYLRDAAGNFYINDKPTGAVVGQQPFGGSRASGTNDKAGSAMNLLRWMTVRTIKENLIPPKTWRYPFMEAE